MKYTLMILLSLIFLTSSAQRTYQFSALIGMKSAKFLPILTEGSAYTFSYDKYITLGPSASLCVERDRKRFGLAFQLSYFSHEINDSPDYDYKGTFRGVSNGGYFYWLKPFLDEKWVLKLGIGITIDIYRYPALTVIYDEETDMPGFVLEESGGIAAGGSMSSIFSLERKLTDKWKAKLVMNYGIDPEYLTIDSYKLLSPHLGFVYVFN